MRISLGWVFGERGELRQEAERVDSVMDGTPAMNLVTLGRVELREVRQRTAQAGPPAGTTLPFPSRSDRGGDVRRGSVGEEGRSGIYFSPCYMFNIFG